MRLGESLAISSKSKFACVDYRLHRLIQLHRLKWLPVQCTAKSLDSRVYRPFAVGVTMGEAKHAATILEYDAWAFSMGHKYKEHVCNSFAAKQNDWSMELPVC